MDAMTHRCGLQTGVAKISVYVTNITNMGLSNYMVLMILGSKSSIALVIF
jgi:hypothetical protein